MLAALFSNARHLIFDATPKRAQKDHLHFAACYIPPKQANNIGACLMGRLAIANTASDQHEAVSFCMSETRQPTLGP